MYLHANAQTDTYAVCIYHMYTPPPLPMYMSFYTEQIQMRASSESKGTIRESGNQDVWRAKIKNVLWEISKVYR